MAAEAAPDPGQIIYLKDWLTLAALVFGPLLSVWWTFYHDARKEKRAAKERLFLSLMGHRKSNPIAPDWVRSLNLIDVVYADHPRVRELWHSLYLILNTNPLNYQSMNYAHLELLSEMADTLGYPTLKQTDIDKFYIPDAHITAANTQGELQVEFLRVLKATAHMGAANSTKKE